MAINRDKLEQHLKDYAKVTGESTDCFVCPITRHRCSNDELVDGHILNAKLHKASRRTVIQYGRVDHFFGSRVEPAIVQFWNESEASNESPAKHECPTHVRFKDGSMAKAYPVTSKAFDQRGQTHSGVTIQSDRGTVYLLVEIPQDDPKWQSGDWKVRVESKFRHFDWVAGMLKVGYLTWFDLMGYRAVFDTCGNAVRQSLARYFDDSAGCNEVDKYFGEFQNAVKVFGIPAQTQGDRTVIRPLEFDTLEDRMMLFHLTGRTVFASTCLYSINGSTASVTLPLSVGGGDVGEVWKTYSKLMRGDDVFAHTTHRVEYLGTSWGYKEQVTLLFPPGSEKFYAEGVQDRPAEVPMKAAR